MTTYSAKAFLAVCCTALTPLAWATEWVVLESTANAYKAGDVLNTESMIAVAAKQSITLLSSQGDSRVLQGPTKTSLADLERAGANADGSKITLALNRLVASRSLDETQTGTIRTPADLASSGIGLEPNNLPAEHHGLLSHEPWDHLTSQILSIPNTTQCIRIGMNIRLKRLEKGKATIRVKKAGGEALLLSWIENQSEQPWPATIELEDNAVYLISVAGKMVPADVRVRMMHSSISLADPRFQIAKLVSLGCMMQANTLIKMSQ